MHNAKQYICDLNPYQPGLPIELVAREHGIAPDRIIKLASNENPLGPSPKALQALQANAAEVHRYPEQYELLQALAKHLIIDPSALVLGNGSNDVLDLVARTYLSDGDEAISSEYAFVVYQIATQSTGAKNVVVPAQDYGHDLDAMHQAITPKTKIIWIANPNNPTGTFISYEQIKQFIKKVPDEIVVVLDEAYFEYLAPENRVDSVAWLKDHANLILVRTFSKIYGLAGLRIGYGMFHPDIAQLLNRVRQPFNANRPAIQAAAAALTDTEFTKKSYDHNNAGRIQLQTGFDRLGLEYVAGQGNFITVTHKDVKTIHDKLLHAGVIIRELTPYGMPEHVRITIGTKAENEILLSHLQRLLS